MPNQKSFLFQLAFFPVRATAVLLSLSIAGCTNLTNDRTRTQAEGATAGAALGAAAGAALAAGGGGDARKIAKLAGVGAAAGGLAGAAYGTAVANKKEGYILTENELNARMTQIRRQAAQQRAYNVRLEAEIDLRRQQAAEAQAGDRTGTARVREVQLRNAVTTRVRKIDRDARVWQDVIDEQKQALSNMAEGRRTRVLEQGIEELSNQRAELIQKRDELMAIGEKLE